MCEKGGMREVRRVEMRSTRLNVEHESVSKPRDDLRGCRIDVNSETRRRKSIVSFKNSPREHVSNKRDGREFIFLKATNYLFRHC